MKHDNLNNRNHGRKNCHSPASSSNLMKRHSLANCYMKCGGLIKSLFCGCLVLIGVSGVEAKTLAWYQFGEGEVGTQPARGEAVILNSANPAKWPARAYEHKGSGDFGLTTGTTYMPVYADAFEYEDMFVYDPVTKEKENNKKSLLFSSKDKNGYGDSSIVLVDEDAEFVASRTYTIEAFFKSASDVPNDACWRTLFCKDYPPFEGGNVAAEHGFRIGAKAGFNVEFRVYKNKNDATQYAGHALLVNNTTVLGISCGNVAGYNFRDGAWHHVALVVDDTNSKAYVYLDYELVGTTDYSGMGHAYRAPGFFAIGQTHCRAYGSFNAYIDNVRVSDEALTAERFLRIGAREPQYSPDTVLHMSFDHPGFGRTNRVNNFIHEANFFNDFKPTVTYQSNNNRGKMTFDENDGETYVKSGVVESGNGCMNKFGANFEPQEEQFYTPYFVIDDRENGRHKILSDSFTIETIIKMPNQIYKQSGTSTLATYLMGKLMRNSNGGHPGNFMVQASGNPVKNLGVYMWSRAENNRITVGTCANVFDGNRHHIAITYDRAKQLGALWVDHQLKGSATFDYVDDIDGEVDDSSLLNLGGMYNNDRYGVLGAIEEFRLSKRALKVQEFLTVTPEADDDYRALIDFDDDLSVAPYPVETGKGKLTGTGELSARVAAKHFATATGAKGRENLKCLELSGGEVCFADNLRIEGLTEQTIEFFVKTGDANSNLVRLEKSGGNVWSVGLAGGALKVETAGNVRTISGARISGTSWHHVALTIAKTQEGNYVVAFVDGKQADAWHVAGEIDYGTAGETQLVFGGATAAFDAFKVSGRVLSVNELTRFYQAGTIFLIR